jgi:hypothetical protein
MFNFRSFETSTMEWPKKRRVDDTEAHADRYGRCIIHMKSSSTEDFTYIVKTANPGERFQRIQDIKTRRLSQPLDSPHRMSDICAQIPDVCYDNQGYHRDCYMRFTANLNRLLVTEEAQSTSRRESRRSSVTNDIVLFTPDCIFCNKVGRKAIKVKGIWTTEATKSFERGSSGETGTI